MKKVIFFIIILCLALGAAGFWYWQRNPYSKEILKLEILGPGEADVGQEVEYIVKYKNNGNVRLEEPRLIFEFPEHSLSVVSFGETDEEEGFVVRRELGPEDLGDIYPGEEKTISFKAKLFGKEGELKTAKVWLNYRPKNLRARYESATTFTTVIKFLPLTFDFDLPSRIETGRDFKFYLNYFSSLDNPLTNLGVKVEYPPGFEFLESSPESLGKIEWEIPLLNKTEGGRIEIKGRLLGEFREQKIFRATFGIWQQDEFIVLKEITRGVEIIKPHLSVFQRINGSDSYIANPGEVLHYEIFFRNIGEEPFKDLFLVAELQGRAFDFDSVKVNEGQFSEGDNSLIWDWRDVAELRFLGQGEEGKVDFWINLKKEWEPGTNSVLRNSVLLSRAREEFETKINSKLAVSQKGYFQDGVFENSGPVPPKVGEKTTYTIVWEVKNYYNDVRNIRVRALLPSNVSLTGKISPEEESSKFAFDSLSREIVWTVKDNEIIEAGTGILSPAPSIAFQVALTPTSDQKGEAAPIIGEARIRGEDQWTENIIGGRSSEIDTSLPDDSSLSSEEGVVE